MIDIKDHFRQYQQEDWLVAGKGPSFDKLMVENFAGRTVALNHSFLEAEFDYLHCIDFDVFQNCEQQLMDSEALLIMPYFPHFEQKPTQTTLHDLFNEYPNLVKLNEHNRLITYNHLDSQWLKHHDIDTDEIRDVITEVRVRRYSSEAMMNILGMSGIRQVTTIGIDGGETYAEGFRSTKQNNYDSQGYELIRAIDTYALNYNHNIMPLPIRVFVGMTESQRLAFEVLKYSIMKYTNFPVKVVRLDERAADIPIPKDESKQPRTPFSFQRFLIPELVNFSGHAIYLDSDMLLLSDIGKLWQFPFLGSDMLATEYKGDEERGARYAVMLIDADKARWDIAKIVNLLDNTDLSYEDLMAEMCITPNHHCWIPRAWNSLDKLDNDTKLIHYTDMNRQPWLFQNHPYENIWLQHLEEGIESGAIDKNILIDEIDKQHVRPELLSLINLDKGRGNDKTAGSFIPPHLRGSQ